MPAWASCSSSASPATWSRRRSWAACSTRRVKLKTPLFVVLGHEHCGAVEAALDAKLRGARYRSRIERLLADIVPGLKGIDPGLPHDEQLQRGVEANVRWSLEQIRATPEAQAKAATGEFMLVGAVYEIESGVVRFLP